MHGEPNGSTQQEKIVLIKFVLFAQSIYLCSISLAPQSIIQEINGMLWNFLWQGGKATSNKKFNLISRDMVCSPKQLGGMGVRDPHDMNQALGEKILWRICTGGSAWWKSTLHKKYMAGKRSRCVDSLNFRKVGSPVWELCKKTNSLIKDNMYWIAGNGKKIQIWYDKIGQNSPVENF